MTEPSLQTPPLRFVFFGGEPLGVPTLEVLASAGFTPALIVCNPDRPVGRKQVLTPPPVKTWATNNDVPVFQPTNCKDRDALKILTEETWDLFIVVAYNHILPQWLIELPKYGTLNVHPSLLPEFRGPSPIRSAILSDRRETGVTVMQMDSEMDHGPIVAQEIADIPEESWPLPGRQLDTILAMLGAQLLVETIPPYIRGDIDLQEQAHEFATYTKKLSRTDGELTLDPHHLPTGTGAYATYLKICAYDGWPGTFFMHDGKRVKITKAELAPSGELRILSVIPEGKAEMDFEQYLR